MGADLALTTQRTSTPLRTRTRMYMASLERLLEPFQPEPTEHFHRRVDGRYYYKQQDAPVRSCNGDRACGPGHIPSMGNGHVARFVSSVGLMDSLWIWWLAMGSAYLYKVYIVTGTDLDKL